MTVRRCHARRVRRNARRLDAYYAEKYSCPLCDGGYGMPCGWHFL